MYPAKFDYHRAATVDEALALLKEHSDAKLIAGGHSLLPMMKLRLAQPPVLIDIGRISELSGISHEAGTIRIGALTTHSEIAASTLIQDRCQVLAEAAGEVGDPQVRNRGTIGGNIAHADPASDLPAVLRSLGANMHIVGPNGKRHVGSDGFFLDLLTTDLQPDEVLTAIEVPELQGKSGSCYLKFEHPASGYAVVGAAAWVSLDDDGVCNGAGLAFNGLTATPLLAEAVTGLLLTRTPNDPSIDAAVDDALTADEPLTDVFASGEYRLHLAKVYGKRALKLARERAGG